MANIVLVLSVGPSGGTTQLNPNQSIGGAIATNPGAIINEANTSLNNLWDNITKTENFNNTVDYRCVYIKNDDGAGGIFASPTLFISGNSKADFEVGFDAAGVNGTAQTVADELTAPSGVTFSVPTITTPLSLPTDLNDGDYIGLWIKRSANNITGSGTITDIFSLEIDGVG